MVVFLAIRCFSCQAFQVNQKTKSGKWKCRLCGEGQSIVKVWGRGDHAKDVRGLVMELNAVAGRGDDPNIVLRNFVGVALRPQARDNRNLSGGMTDQDDGFDFSVNGRTAAVPRHRQQQQYTGGEGRIRSAEPANWTRGEGFMPAGLAPGGVGRDSTAGEGCSADSWETSQAEPTGYGGYCARGGVGFDTHPEHSAAFAHASTWRPSAEPPEMGGRGGSRWGAFASDEATQVLKKRQGPDQQIEENPNFVTSIETAPPRRRASPKPERRGRKRNPPSSWDGRRGHPSEESGMSPPHWALGQDQAEKESTCVATSADAHDFEGGDPWRHQKARRREWSPSSYAPHAGQADPPMTALWGGGREQRDRESFGMNRGSGSDTGGGVWEKDGVAPPIAQGSAGMPRHRGMFSGESHGSSPSSTFDGGGGHGGVGGTGSSSSSRWSKFLR